MLVSVARVARISVSRKAVAPQWPRGDREELVRPGGGCPDGRAYRPGFLVFSWAGRYKATHRRPILRLCTIAAPTPLEAGRAKRRRLCRHFPSQEDLNPWRPSRN